MSKGNAKNSPQKSHAHAGMFFPRSVAIPKTIQKTNKVDVYVNAYVLRHDVVADKTANSSPPPAHLVQQLLRVAKMVVHILNFARRTLDLFTLPLQVRNRF